MFITIKGPIKYAGRNRVESIEKSIGCQKVGGGTQMESGVTR